MIKKNFKEEFDAILTVRDGRGTDIGFPAFDFRAVFYTNEPARCYTASCIGGECVNCHNDGDKIHVVFNRHGLLPGIIKCRFESLLPNGIYPDGNRCVPVVEPLNIELTFDASDMPSEVEIAITIPAFKGDPFKYSDFTPAQLDDLRRPAVEAAEKADAATADATAAAIRAETGEAARQKAEEARIAAEAQRAEAEAARRDAEAIRLDAEKTRATAEAERKAAENTRKAGEGERASAETERQAEERTRRTAEAVRIAEEVARATAETQRQAEEATRRTAEAARIAEEKSRTSSETARQKAEQTRSSAEDLRRDAETARQSAETARAKAEAARATEFAGFEDAIAAKLDKAVWDGEHAQFNIVGYINDIGADVGSPNFHRTGLIPINHGYDIAVRAFGYKSSAALTLYDVKGAALSVVVHGSGTSLEEKIVTLAAADIPEGAVYFACCTHNNRLADSHWSNGPTREAREGAVSDAAAAVYAEAQRAVFDQIYAAYGVTKDPATGLYSLNGLTDITEAEMLAIYADMQRTPSNVMAGASRGNLRTNLWVATGISASDNEITARGMFDGWGRAEVLNVSDRNDSNFTTKISGVAVFKACRRLKKILGVFRLFTQDACSKEPFSGCAALEELTLTELKYSVSFADSPLLSLASLEYLVANAANTGPITVTVHPTVYAKLTNTDGLEDYLPANLLTGAFNNLNNATAVDNGVECIGPGLSFYMSNTPQLLKAGIGKLTLSCDVEGLQEGESLNLLIGSSSSFPRPALNISANGRTVVSFDFDSHFALNSERGVLLYDMYSAYTGQGQRLTNFKLSYGEHDTLPYTGPVESIEDAELRERVKWASLVYMAAAKQITFASV